MNWTELISTSWILLGTFFFAPLTGALVAALWPAARPRPQLLELLFAWLALQGTVALALFTSSRYFPLIGFLVYSGFLSWLLLILLVLLPAKKQAPNEGENVVDSFSGSVKAEK